MAEDQGAVSTDRKQRLWRASRFLAGLVAGILGTVAAWVSIDEWQQRAEILLAWHNESEGQYLTLARDADVVATLEDLEQGEIKVPVRLALMNEGSETARSVRLEVAYPDDVEVSSQVARSIRSEGPSRVFRHDFGDLVPARSFTPIPSIDVIRIPVKVVTDRFVVLTKDGLPIYLLTLYMFPVTERDELVLGLSLFSENIDPMDMTLTLRLPKVAPHVQFLEGDADARFEEVEAHHRSVIAEAAKHSCIRGGWSERIDPGHLVDYCSLALANGSVVQLIRVDEEIRRVIVDSDADTYVDYELWDTDQNGEVDRRVVWDRPVVALEWAGGGD